jgi:hypothetical protein
MNIYINKDMRILIKICALLTKKKKKKKKTIPILYKTMSNAQPTMDSLRELNTKLIAEIAELRKMNPILERSY